MRPPMKPPPPQTTTQIIFHLLVLVVGRKEMELVPGRPLWIGDRPGSPAMEARYRAARAEGFPHAAASARPAFITPVAGREFAGSPETAEKPTEEQIVGPGRYVDLLACQNNPAPMQ